MSLVYNIIFKINFIVQRDRRLQKITPKVAVFQIPKGKVQGLDFTWGGGGWDCRILPFIVCPREIDLEIK